MKRISILFLTNAYPDFESSYRGIFIKKMVTLLKKEGFHISVATPKIYTGSRYFENQDEIKVYRFPFCARNKLLIEHKKIPYIRMLLYYITGLLLGLYATLRNQCNVIHAHWAIPSGLIALTVAFLLKKQLIVTIHGSDLRMALEKPGFLRNIFLYVCKRAAKLNCVSEVQRKDLEKLGIPREKICTIPMGIGEEFLERGEHRGRKLEDGPFTILSNRNLLPIYNVSLLIRAVPIVVSKEPATKFIIAGDGAEREALEREAESLKIYSSVRFLGRIPHEDMPNLLSEADIYVSTSFYDGTSVSLLEAMGSGAFPIVTDIPSNREWIKDGDNGFLVPVTNENLLARKILDAMRNHILLGEARDKNRRIIEDRAYWSENIKRIAELYHYSP